MITIRASRVTCLALVHMWGLRTIEDVESSGFVERILDCDDTLLGELSTYKGESVMDIGSDCCEYIVRHCGKWPGDVRILPDERKEQYGIHTIPPL